MQVNQLTANNTPSPDTKHDSTCPFCEKPKTGDTRNDLSHNAPKLRVQTNSGDVLGTAEPHVNAGGPKWTINYVNPKTGKSGTSNVRSNPHHCIPANASLKGHDILKFVEYDRNQISDNIGYDVNGQTNGVWLPTIPEDFYGGNEIPALAGIRWGGLTERYPSEQFTIAEAAMNAAKRQFHDAHPAYSSDVKLRLDMINTGMRVLKARCPEAKEKGKADHDIPAPYGLVRRLDGLSARMARYLDGDALKWLPPLFTSRHAEAFYTKVKAAQTANPQRKADP
jgi:A nuclease family of the HNH/ENDO VII superfamily with conserved AHH